MARLRHLSPVSVNLSHISTIPGKTPEESVLYYARVSNPESQNKSGGRLLQYLIDHEHWSPFEMVSMCIDISTTRDISRQILRHRSFSFQEFSQRYAKTSFEMHPNCIWEKREARLQDTKNRQNSIELDPENEEHQKLSEQWEFQMYDVVKATSEAYRWALEHGIAKEQARSVLPEGLVSTRLFMHGTLRSWIHYVALRSGPETQKEHRVIAEKCKKILIEQCPNIPYTAFCNSDT